MSRRRMLLVVPMALAVAAGAGGAAWEYHQLDTYRPLAWAGGETGGDFFRHGIPSYQIPDDAYGRYAGTEVEVMPVGSGRAYLGFSIYNSGDHAVTITGLAHPVSSDPAGHLRIVNLLSPDGYQGSPAGGVPGLGPPQPFRATTIPAHQYRWIGARFVTTTCAGISGSKRFVIGQLPLRIHYVRFFDAVQVFQMPAIAVATCGKFHPVLNP